MKKAKATRPQITKKTIGTRIIEKYRPKMNQLTEAERKQLLDEGLAIVYHSGQVRGHAHRS
jgi:hypothetical protein